jgi:hypothetical protein
MVTMLAASLQNKDNKNKDLRMIFKTDEHQLEPVSDVPVKRFGASRTRKLRRDTTETPEEVARQRDMLGTLVKLHKYCSDTGDTAEAVHTRRKRGEWIDGKHCHLVAGRRLWIDIAEVNAWICNHSRA